ncbi:glycoside hydrolase family 30 beta sandwich domain-containing protein [Rhizobacter sp. OV335]|uniref:glycoside hydrolase family 30 beta sandwich domain-containing protein n=1 Tax=Rhizobacter sp. OV335 TaxID=1500264 RepID=UPI00091A823F|nr:glycoside hydrolase family 30 beta sandwich domain-containing protein [Rhizobacter sp. OV335]SHN12952.1 glucuronoarabinoxylan endo-1,4-beta-xylanase [Rhizobacter sp. OV335]
MPGTFTYSPAVGAKPEVGVQSLTLKFTPQDTAKYSTVTVVQKLTVNKAQPPARWDLPAAVLQGSALTAAQITTSPYALYGVQGTADAASYMTIDGKPLGTATTAAAGTAIVQATFVPRDGAHYSPAVISTTLTIKPASTTAAIDFGDTKQTIQGFGGSAAWYYSKMSEERLNVLFGTSLADSLGLNIIRLRIAPANWNASAKTADTTQWTAELENGIGAQARGAIVFASPWSPPASMKIVNTERSNPLYSGRLDPAMYADYAQYLNAYIRYAATRNVKLHAVSLQNEPDWDPKDYESCLWNADEMTAWVGGYGATAIAGTTTRLMAAESFYYSQATTDTLLADSKAAGNLSIVGGHLYGGTPNYSSAAAKLGKDVWMTEHFLDSVNKSDAKTSWQTSIDDAIAMAKEVHDGLTLSQYNAYVHWWLVNSNDSTPTGLIGTNNKPTYFGIGLKHFSYFIRPGYVRYDATALPQKGVRVSAFGTPPGAADSKAVVVLVNENAADVTLTTSIAPAGRSLTSLTPYRTTATATFAQQPAIGVSANTFSISLPAKSITTLVN